MSLFSKLRTRARDVLSKTPARAEAPVGAHSAAPKPSTLGASPWKVGSIAPTASTPPGSWDRDPETGAPLPTGANPSASPTDHQAARLAHRHGWFAALAWRAAQGDAAAAAEAVSAMESWLRQDVPGTGLAWAHASDLSARLIHWQAGLTWLGAAVPVSLREAMAGSAAWHLDHLDVRTPAGDSEGLRRVLHHAGRVVGGFLFPDLEQARAAWSEGVAGLREDLPGLMYNDGSPRDAAPLALAEVLWFAAIARATVRVNGAGFPADADAALARGAHFCARLTGNVGTLPNIGDRFVGTVLDTGYPLGWSLWNLLVGWGVESGEASLRVNDDPRIQWLGAPAGADPVANPSKNWSVWVWREGGFGLAEMKIKNRPSRVVAHHGVTGRGSGLTHLAPLQIVWDLGDFSILADPGPAMDHPPHAEALRGAQPHNGILIDGRSPPSPCPAEFDIGRVDGKKARLDGHHTGWTKVGIPVIHRRKVLMNQARVTVTDHLEPARASIGRHAVQLAWQFGPGWVLELEGKQWTAKQGGISVLINLSEALSWSLVSGQTHPHPLGWVGATAAPCLVGSGGIEGEVKFDSSFEVR